MRISRLTASAAIVCCLLITPICAADSNDGSSTKQDGFHPYDDKTSEKVSEERMKEIQDLREQPLFTILTSPKDFVDGAWRNQKNAILSWTQLVPKPQIFLFGDPRGIDSVIKDIPGVVNVKSTPLNACGTPTLDGIINYGEQHSSAPVIIYMNSDLILTQEMTTAVYKVMANFDQFLLVGQRIELPESKDKSRLVKAEMDGWLDTMDTNTLEMAVNAPESWQDYFIFSRGLYGKVPPIAIGRAYIDRWLVHSRFGLPDVHVIDATKVVLVIHQAHDYNHIKGSKLNKNSGKSSSSGKAPAQKKGKRQADQTPPADEAAVSTPSTTGKSTYCPYNPRPTQGRQEWVNAGDTLLNINIIRNLNGLPDTDWATVNWTHTSELTRAGRCDSAKWMLEYDESKPLHLALRPNVKYNYELFGPLPDLPEID